MSDSLWGGIDIKAEEKQAREQLEKLGVTGNYYETYDYHEFDYFMSTIEHRIKS